MSAKNAPLKSSVETAASSFKRVLFPVAFFPRIRWNPSPKWSSVPGRTSLKVCTLSERSRSRGASFPSPCGSEPETAGAP